MDKPEQRMTAEERAAVAQVSKTLDTGLESPGKKTNRSN